MSVSECVIMTNQPIVCDLRESSTTYKYVQIASTDNPSTHRSDSPPNETLKARMEKPTHRN